MRFKGPYQADSISMGSRSPFRSCSPQVRKRASKAGDGPWCPVVELYFSTAQAKTIWVDLDPAEARLLAASLERKALEAEELAEWSAR